MDLVSHKFTNTTIVKMELANEHSVRSTVDEWMVEAVVKATGDVVSEWCSVAGSSDQANFLCLI
jgi:hypothetical protein